LQCWTALQHSARCNTCSALQRCCAAPAPGGICTARK
jgi:hypothetical protein